MLEILMRKKKRRTMLYLWVDKNLYLCSMNEPSGILFY